MQSKPTIKTLIEESVNGNFKIVHKFVNSQEIQVETSGAVKIIVAICNACFKNLSTPEKINSEELIKLIKCLLKFIKIPPSENYDQYLQSAFYILKLLIEQKSLKSILQLEELFIPEFMPLILSEKQLSVYQNICKSLYNVIIRISQAKDTHNSDIILKISYLLTTIYRKIDKKKNLCESARNCIISLVNLGIPPNELTQFYQHSLRLLDRIEDLSLYPLLINNFSLIYTHLLKNEQYNLATECFTVTGDQLKLIIKGNEYNLLWEIAEIVVFQPKKADIEKSHNSLKNYYRRYKSSKNLQSVCDLISSVAFTLLQIYKKSNQWLEVPDIHSSYYNFLNDVAVILAKTPYICNCKNCSIKMNINDALRILNTIGGLGRLFITNKNETSRNYKLDILRYLEKFTSHVNILKENGCEKWTKYTYDLGVHLYTIGVNLYQKKDTEMSLTYLNKFVQIFLNESKIIDQTYLHTSFNLISDIYLESQDYEKCLLITSLSIILNETPKNEINRWLKTKATLREKTIEENALLQELTLVSICDKYRNELQFYFSDREFKLNKERKIELLIYELRQYNLKWKSKIPMSATFRELSYIASAQCAAEIFIEIWGDGDMLVHETLPLLLQDVIHRIEMENISKKDIFLAHLYFLQHRYKVKDTIVKHCDEMEKNMTLSRANNAVINGVLPPDPDDECDLVSSYDCLKLTKYVKMMKQLNAALNLIHSWLAKNSLDGDSERERIFKLLANIGHEYCLHNHSTKSLQAWELALKVSSTPLQKLQATGFIIELADVRKPYLQKLIEDAEKSIHLLPTDKNFEELSTYYLCKAEAFFWVDFQKANGSFQEAKKLQLKYQFSKILQARVYLLEHKFISLPCEYEVEGHTEYSLVRIHQANNAANLYYNETTSTSSFDMRIFFDIYETLVKMYHDLTLPREERCYARDCVVIAQKMVLPLRTTTFLYYLAYADISTCRFDDCKIKIKDFSDILGLAKAKIVPSVASQSPTKEHNDFVQDLGGELKEMMLDVPTRVAKSTSSGSPVFSAEIFKVPLFLSHETNCECFYCTCIEYQEFVLKKTFLNGLLHVYDNNTKLGVDFFGGCNKICNILKERETVYTKKLSSKMTVDLIPNVSERVLEVFCLSTMEYVNCLFRKDKFEEAKTTNTRILEKLERFRLKYIHLYNEVLSQRLDILVSIADMNKQPQSKTNPIQDEIDNNVKTPPSQKNQLLISPMYNAPEHPDAIKLFRKSLKFDLSDSEEDKNDNPKNVVLPPFLNAKTPAPSGSKIKVYTNKSTKKTTVLTEMPKFKEPEVCTPSVGDKNKLNPQLASRTKLLTERLKNSSRKTQETDEKTTNKVNVRQNLFRQMSDNNNLEKCGSVRKSARNKK